MLPRHLVAGPGIKSVTMVIKRSPEVSDSFCLYTNLTLLIITAAVADSNLDLDTMSTKRLMSVDFEVFGKVQGVFFRKYTQEQAKKLGLKGWCMNTERGTVQGMMQGDIDKINEMKHWLQYTGSRSSRIDKAVFTNELEVKKCDFSKFDIRR